MSSYDVNVVNPLLVPYRTGTYLISDAGPDNFRNAMTLGEHPYRASGSHQVGIADWARILAPVVLAYQPKRIWLVDLREETHGYFNGEPVSWYADNDFSNVGQDKRWIIKHEEMMVNLHANSQTELFVIEDDASDDLKQERVLPTSYTPLWVGSARTEDEVAGLLDLIFKPTNVQYCRIPVTDHCAPSKFALTDLDVLSSQVGKDDWVHFHCHGGDGRTTSFLAMYDMLSQWEWGDPLPTLEAFSDRQCELFDYCLDPKATSCGNPPKAWQLSLAEQRWTALGDYLDRLRAR
jgi:hypothetical protein